MNRRFLTAAFGAALLVAAGLPAGALAKDPQRATQIPMGSIDVRLHAGMLADKVGDVMLELSGTPVVVRQADAAAAGRTLTTSQRTSFRKSLKTTQDALRARIVAAGGKVVGQYQDAYNGIKVRVNLGQVSKLAKLPGVKAVHALQIYTPLQRQCRALHRGPAGLAGLRLHRQGRQDRHHRHRDRLLPRRFRGLRQGGRLRRGRPDHARRRRVPDGQGSRRLRLRGQRLRRDR